MLRNDKLMWMLNFHYNYLDLIFFRVKEERFWRNYFYRVSLIKQSSQLSTLAQAGELLSVTSGPIPELR